MCAHDASLLVRVLLMCAHLFRVNSIKEMLLGNSISRDLDDRSFLIDSCLSVLAVQVAMTMTRPDRVDKLYEGEKNSKSRSFMIKVKVSAAKLTTRTLLQNPHSIIDTMTAGGVLKTAVPAKSSPSCSQQLSPSSLPLL